jgi:hypothetical protein
MAEKYAAAVGVPADEFFALAEKIAREAEGR